MAKAENTLAAQVFEDRPELIAVAERTDTYADLINRLAPMTVDETGANFEVGDPKVEIDSGGAFCVVEGDLLLDADELHLYALRREAMRSVHIDDPVPSVSLEPSQSLTGISVGGVPARWDDPTALAYSVFEKSFPDRNAYAVACENLAAAATDWQQVCGVRFVHRPEFDGQPNPTVELADLDLGLTFAVRYIDAGGQFVASAFFPTSPPSRRRLFVDPSYYAADLRFDRVGVLRHELGHVLGFRHEHIRSGAPPECPKETGGPIVNLTEYDPQSVMHYFCGGVGTSELAITASDAEGARTLYGPSLEN